MLPYLRGSANFEWVRAIGDRHTLASTTGISCSTSTSLQVTVIPLFVSHALILLALQHLGTVIECRSA